MSSKKKQASNTSGFFNHTDLKEKLVIGHAISGVTWAGFARELANALTKNKGKSASEVADFGEELNGRIAKVRNAGVKSQATYELIDGTSNFLGIDSKYTPEHLAQISVTDYFSLLPDAEKGVLLGKINLPSADQELIAVGDQCGVHREAAEAVLEPSRKHANLHEDLHSVFLDIGRFEFCDLDRHDVSEVQKYMYFDSGAVNNWGALIADADNKYPNYRHCLQSLLDFLGHDYWKNLIRENRISRTINLGAGTPDKDRAIISSCTTLKADSKNIVLPTHYIVDSSLYMLIDTIKELCYTRWHSRKITETEPITVSGDFMHLSKLIPRVEVDQDGGNATRSAFFMLGGTIGNINPQHFMDSICSVANRGDLLIISGEFLPDSETEIESFKRNATAHYNHRLAKQLVAPAARAVLRCKKFARLPDKNAADEAIISQLQATSRLDINPRIKLQKTLKIVFTYKNGKTSFDVVEANRYVEQEFIDFVVDYGFSYVQPHGGSQMKQLVFEKS